MGNRVTTQTCLFLTAIFVVLNHLSWAKQKVMELNGGTVNNFQFITNDSFTQSLFPTDWLKISNIQTNDVTTPGFYLPVFSVFISTLLQFLSAILYVGFITIFYSAWKNIHDIRPNKQKFSFLDSVNLFQYPRALFWKFTFLYQACGLKILLHLVDLLLKPTFLKFSLSFSHHLRS